ncbi:MAG: hypothetical protein M5U14_08345 [Acidimicrobiia bacterium]|nr:hypothetical protein [Acidimicrobiia bacterium]
MAATGSASRRNLVTLAVVLAGLVAAGLLVAWPALSPHEAEVHAYDVPPGTGDRLDRGEDVELFPARLEVRVGDTLRITNRDDREHLVGPFSVGAGETLEQTFRQTGVFEGICTLHPSGNVKIVVVD